MKIVFLDVESNKKVYREYNGGYGTSFNAGKSFLGKLLTSLRVSNENFPYMPYAYAATIFKQKGHDVSIQSNNISDDTNLVIMHASMPNHSEELKYLKKLKERNISVGLIGPFAGMKPELFQDSSFIIKGDIEEVVKEIAETEKIPKGLINAPSIKNLDNLPFPDWSLFPINEYSYSPIINKKPFTFVLSSRGCTYTCNYCPYISESNHGRSYRMRSVDNVIQELKYLKEKFGIKGIQFRDPLFTLIRKRIVELCNKIIEEKIDMEIGCETRLDRVDKELLDLMYKAGFRVMKVGIESASAEVLKKSKRLPIELKHQEEMIKYCDKIGIKIVGF